MVKLVMGSFSFIVGLFLLFTGVGAIIGIPMVAAGLWMGFAGFTSLGVGAVKAGIATGKVVRDMKNSGTSVPSSTASSGSVADEIAKLADLLSAGHLTQAEFDQRKAQLLSR
jgi:hypothetical protein